MGGLGIHLNFSLHPDDGDKVTTRDLKKLKLFYIVSEVKTVKMGIVGAEWKKLQCPDLVPW